jgi:hypothetical protein
LPLKSFSLATILCVRHENAILAMPTAQFRLNSC